MSPNDRERERAKRRYEKQQAARQRHEAEARRNRQVVAIVVAVLLVVGGLVGISLAMRGTSGTPTAATTPGATGTTAPVVQGCSTPPAVPGARTATLPPKATAAGKTFVATVTTSCGDITMELDGARAPQTVASFLGLARSGYWNDSPCHRLVTSGIFVLQCGDPTGSGSGGPGYRFADELSGSETYPAGTLAMANAGPGTNGSQFFIVYADSRLSPNYTVFGHTDAAGIAVVKKIGDGGQDGSYPDGSGKPVLPAVITGVVAG